MQETAPYLPKNKVRIVTAASLFDGHDASINIMRRIIQSTGCEVIHLGHDRSAEEIVNCAIQEDAQAIAITSYQGGHMEFFKYMYDLLQQKGSDEIMLFGGGGGVILPEEIQELHQYGITRIYSPDDGRMMGLQGMINDLVAKCDFPKGEKAGDLISLLPQGSHQHIAQLISTAENNPDYFNGHLTEIKNISSQKTIPVIGITGTGGSGKSSLVDELIRRFLDEYKTKKPGIISVDPSKRKTGGALLGDRIRMNAIDSPRVFMRSMATRRSHQALSQHIDSSIEILKAAGYDLIILETSGIGQSDSEITDHCDISVYVMTPEYGAASQLEKIDMLDFADLVAINKSDKRGAPDALRDVKKQYQRNHNLFHESVEDMPVFTTTASLFNDTGTTLFYHALIARINERFPALLDIPEKQPAIHTSIKGIVPPERVRYLSEISHTIRQYNKTAKEQADLADQLYSLKNVLNLLEENEAEPLTRKANQLEKLLTSENMETIEQWERKKQKYRNAEYVFSVRGKEIRIATTTKSLSNQDIPKIALPRYRSWGDIVQWTLQENVPGEFPYTAGLYPFKREGEDPTRMFAGEGGPERTNRRFHYLSKGMPAKRLSTAFDSVTLYGHDPDRRPDIYGKIGNSGVSVCCLDDAKKLYSGFDLCHPGTSVSMTINGPAPMLLACFMNAAIDQQCELYIRKEGLEEKTRKTIEKAYQEKDLPVPAYYGDLPEDHNGLGLMLLGTSGDKVLPPDVYANIKKETLSKVRGTVQADILKEDQAQNTCIFSTEFALRLMGDVQEYFIQNEVRNFYSVSISGYHIAEAGANPITQLAFTLANGFTYIEYYLGRGMDIDDFAPNFSFFFSNGIDPEYAVIGRVSRRIWAKAIAGLYKGNKRSQMLKYHIQTSGRSLHAQEIDFNDIRTTLQALYAIYDNCNSLHTNAYDEAVTTPTEESVRRAVAIQLIINKELGLAKNENPLQGSFIIEELTDLVEEAVMMEFDRITERGGVPGAMETMYQRSKIQEESLYYETKKHSGEYPIIGVNTFLSSNGSPTIIPGEVIRATEREKEDQITTLRNLNLAKEPEAEKALTDIRDKALKGDNLFEAFMDAVKVCSLGQITRLLFDVGGQYRRSM